MLALFFKGWLIGLAIAAPVGPIGVLCIQRALQDGFKLGLLTGMGAALADGVYGLIAGFGLTSISSFLVAHQFFVRLCGGIFLIYMGVKLIMARSQAQPRKENKDKSLWHACATTFFLTLTNPMTILSFIAVFAGLGLGTIDTTYAAAILLVLGIVLGSATWWTLLAGGVALVLHHRVRPTYLRAINWISGAIIVIFGIIALIYS